MNGKADLVVMWFKCDICKIYFPHVVQKSIPELYDCGLVAARDDVGHIMNYIVVPYVEKEVEQNGSGKET